MAEQESANLKDERPTKAQFLAMPDSHRRDLMKPRDKDGNHYPEMNPAQLAEARRQLGMTHNELAKAIKLRGKKPGDVVASWEGGKSGSVHHRRLSERASLIPGPHAKAINDLVAAKQENVGG